MTDSKPNTPFPEPEPLCVARPFYAAYEIPNEIIYKNKLYSFITELMRLDRIESGEGVVSLPL